ncbi:hypothetical protein NIES2104_56240 [Leptolyngbya sp. NIES-2104]|nr:hypothetical protein NIES2104_56240 [Leptolyngbya sp. NIES-2104]
MSPKHFQLIRSQRIGASLLYEISQALQLHFQLIRSQRIGAREVLYFNQS